MSESVPIMRSSESFQVKESGADRTALDHECMVFSAYLVNQKPSSYVLEKYREAHMMSSEIRRHEAAPFDQLLLNVSIKHPIIAKLVDAYTAIFYKGSLIRKKWILLLAILESCAPTFHYFDSPESHSTSWLLAKMLWSGVVFFLAFCLAVVLFLPLQVMYAGYAKLFGRRV